jgi:hypothetical protein
MTGKPYPTKLIKHLQHLVGAWKQIDPELAIGELTNIHLSAEIEETELLLAQIRADETQLIELRQRRDARYAALWEEAKRVRNGVKAIYGDDSAQYAMIGGKRKSERKTPVRKAKPAAGEGKE